jgi:hypothetical protein
VKRLNVIILALAVLVFSSGIAVASFSNFFWNGYQDMPLPPAPCSTAVGKVATTFNYNGRLWLVYNCDDGSSFARQFTDTSTGTTATPVPLPPPPAPVPSSCTTIQPGPTWVCVNGNWLPPQ